MDRTNEELCLLIQSGNQEAKQDICIKNKRLVSKVAAKYVDTYGNTLDIEDLEQVGYLGLLTAADKFSVDRVRNLIIKVPITSAGEPDWQYMENYIKSLPYGDRL